MCAQGTLSAERTSPSCNRTLFYCLSPFIPCSFPSFFSTQFDPAVKTIPVVRVPSGGSGRAVGEGQGAVQTSETVSLMLSTCYRLESSPSVSHPRGKRSVSIRLDLTAYSGRTRHLPKSIPRMTPPQPSPPLASFCHLDHTIKKTCFYIMLFSFIDSTYNKKSHEKMEKHIILQGKQVILAHSCFF